ncbi:hypothetical protein HMPREF9374_1559 [Desmospora sp. 8437]|nr:hypothetical protein HMPREF9374_1559 [Desmospora sp. 8437]
MPFLDIYENPTLRRMVLRYNEVEDWYPPGNIRRADLVIGW